MKRTMTIEIDLTKLNVYGSAGSEGFGCAAVHVREQRDADWRIDDVVAPQLVPIETPNRFNLVVNASQSKRYS